MIDRCRPIGLLPSTTRGTYFTGFPTLKHIPHTPKLRKGCVKVFQYAARGDSLVLEVGWDIFFEPLLCWDYDDWANPWNVRAKELGCSSTRYVTFTLKFVERKEAASSSVGILKCNLLSGKQTCIIMTCVFLSSSRVAVGMETDPVD